MVLQLDLVGDIELGFLWFMNGLERIDWGLKSCAVSEFNMVQIGPVLVLLLQQVLRLASWRLVVRLLHSPVKLI